MTRVIVSLLLCCLTLSASAQQLPNGTASAKDAARWHHVEQLVPGQRVVVLESGSNRRFPCGLDRVDDDVLTCIPFGFAGPPQRIVYPRASVERVWATEQTYGPSGWAWGIAAAIGAILGGAMFSPAGVGGVFAGIFLGAGVAAGFVAHGNQGYSTREVLIYKAH